MKKGIIALGCALLLAAGTNFSNAQALDEGNFHLDVYSGFPNLLNRTFKSAEELDVDNQVVFSSVPTVGLRFGYMVAKNISLGVDINYSSFNYSYTDENTNYEYNVGLNRIRAMARFEVHFLEDENFDLYLPIAGGYHNLTPVVSTTDPNETNQIEDIESVIGFFDLPVAFRIGFGGRYFFTENFGLNLEFGLGGGPLIEGGLALKF